MAQSAERRAQNAERRAQSAGIRAKRLFVDFFPKLFHNTLLITIFVFSLITTNFGIR